MEKANKTCFQQRTIGKGLILDEMEIDRKSHKGKL